MTPQEQQLLTQLTQRINQTQLQDKDPDAQNLLGKELGANPDALYILAQTALIQDMALQRANSHVADLEKQIQDLQQQLEEDEQQIDQLQQVQQRQTPAKPTSFLGRLFGDPQPAPAQAQYQPVPQPQQGSPAYQPVQYAPQQAQYAQPQYVQAVPMPMGGPMMGGPMMGGPGMMGGQPSFLRSAMQTAAGVAAGTLAVEGIESLFHGGHSGFGGYGGGFGGGFGGGERPVEEVVNNYYGDSPEDERHEGGGGDRYEGEHREGGERFHDASYETSGNYDRGDDRGNDRNYDSSLSDDTAAADDSVSDVQLDDSGSYDDNSNVQ
ncbi:DUF2076 domain-containing protein [Terracidiphilus gabretensis]|uniref:DUF2076 domain-containing protein n=1 Tax=Terracidiphilus gabretensis TaxID=1577687 RepID=UPI00071C19DE|nr:DUF2076 domain-containing protein [Terracidiphilus gabretensis]